MPVHSLDAAADMIRSTAAQSVELQPTPQLFALLPALTPSAGVCALVSSSHFRFSIEASHLVLLPA